MARCAVGSTDTKLLGLSSNTWNFSKVVGDQVGFEFGVERVGGSKEKHPRELASLRTDDDDEVSEEKALRRVNQRRGRKRRGRSTAVSGGATGGKVQKRCQLWKILSGLMMI